MKCKWYTDFEGACTNGECPYRGDTCPTSEYPEVCRHAEAVRETKLNTKELATALRICTNEEECGCENCPYVHLSESGICCENCLKLQAADMLEKLAAEKDEKKPEWISVKDRLPEKKNEAYLCSLDSCLFPGSQYIDIRAFCDDGKWEANGTVTHWMPLPELPKEEER